MPFRWTPGEDCSVRGSRFGRLGIPVPELPDGSVSFLVLEVRNVESSHAICDVHRGVRAGLDRFESPPTEFTEIADRGTGSDSSATSASGTESDNKGRDQASLMAIPRSRRPSRSAPVITRLCSPQSRITSRSTTSSSSFSGSTRSLRTIFPTRVEGSSTTIGR